MRSNPCVASTYETAIAVIVKRRHPGQLQYVAHHDEAADTGFKPVAPAVR